MRAAMRGCLIVAVHAGAIGVLDRLRGRLLRVDTKFDEPAQPHTSTHDGVIAAGPVASFASEPFELVAGLQLEETTHLGFGERAGEVSMAGVTVDAADVPGLGEVTDIRIVVARIRQCARASQQANRDGDRDGDAQNFFRHANSLWQHRGTLARALAFA